MIEIKLRVLDDYLYLAEFQFGDINSTGQGNLTKAMMILDTYT